MKSLKELEDPELEMGSWDDYEIHDELGSGASGTAYTGVKLSTR